MITGAKFGLIVIVLFALLFIFGSLYVDIKFGSFCRGAGYDSVEFVYPLRAECVKEIRVDISEVGQ